MKKLTKKQKLGIILPATIGGNCLLIAGTLIGLAYGFLYDDSHLEIPSEEIDDSEIKSSIMTSLVKTTTSKDKDDTLPMDALNILIDRNLRESIKDTTLNYLLTRVGIYYEDSHFMFSGEASVLGIFKTRMYLTTSLKVQFDEEFEGVYFDIEKIKLARVDYEGVFPVLLSGFVNDYNVDKIISATKLSLKSDLANGRINYSFIDMLDDLGNL